MNAALALYNGVGGMKNMYSFFRREGSTRGNVGNAFLDEIEYKILVNTNLWQLATASAAPKPTTTSSQAAEFFEENRDYSSSNSAEKAEIAKSGYYFKRPMASLVRLQDFPSMIFLPTRPPPK